MTSPDDRDPWLEQALHHAPDADAAPPAALREAILARSREPARGAGGGLGGLVRRLDAAWAWLARPPVAAGFATLAVSTVLGTLWWSGSLDEAADPRVSQPVAPSAASAVASQPAQPLRDRQAPDPAPLAQAPPRAAPEAVRKAASAPARPEPPRAAPERLEPRAPDERTAAAAESAVPPAPGPASPQAPARRAEDSVAASVDRPAEDALRLERRAAPQPSVQAAAPAADASAPAERRRTADQRRQEAQERPADADDRRRSFAAAAPATARAGADPLEPITHLVALRPDDLHWASAGRSHPHGFAQRAWLDTLGALTAGRWERTRTTERDGTPVQLFDGPRVRAEWLIGPQRVLLLDAERGAWQAPLSNADAARLRALADGW